MTYLQRINLYHTFAPASWLAVAIIIAGLALNLWVLRQTVAIAALSQAALHDNVALMLDAQKAVAGSMPKITIGKVQP